MALGDWLIDLAFALPPRFFGALVRPLHRLCSLKPRADSAEFISDGEPEGLEVRPSLIPNAGQGLFATRAIPKGGALCEYLGTPLGFLQLMRTPDWSYIYAGEEAWIDAKPHPNLLARYINDHFDPTKINCAFCDEDERVWIRATRDIAAGEELHASYGGHYWAVMK